MAATRRVFRRTILKTKSPAAAETARVARDVPSRIGATDPCRVLHVQRPGFFVRRSIFSKGCRVRALREGSAGPATRSVAHRESLRRTGKFGERIEVLAEYDLLHHERHENRSARAEPEWRVADSLHFHRARRQIDHERDVRLSQQQRRTWTERR